MRKSLLLYQHVRCINGLCEPLISNYTKATLGINIVWCGHLVAYCNQSEYWLAVQAAEVICFKYTGTGVNGPKRPVLRLWNGFGFSPARDVKQLTEPQCNAYSHWARETQLVFLNTWGYDIYLMRILCESIRFCFKTYISSMKQNLISDDLECFT